MITAEFFLKNEQLTGFSVKGHAGYNDFGLDVVCAAVSSAVEYTANAITEILEIPAVVGAFENEVRLNLPEGGDQRGVDFIKALRLHLELLSEDYKQNIRIIEIEI